MVNGRIRRTSEDPVVFTEACRLPAIALVLNTMLIKAAAAIRSIIRVRHPQKKWDRSLRH